MKTNNGFTLIEVMIAFVVLLIGMLGVMGMQYYAVTGNATSREMRLATSLTQELIEHYKVTPYNDLSATPLPVPFSSNTEVTLTAGITSFTSVRWMETDCVAITLTNDDGTCNPALTSQCCNDPDPDPSYIVDVTAIRTRACWSDKNGNNHSVTLDTLRWD